MRTGVFSILSQCLACQLLLISSTSVIAAEQYLESKTPSTLHKIYNLKVGGTKKQISLLLGEPSKTSQGEWIFEFQNKDTLTVYWNKDEIKEIYYRLYLPTDAQLLMPKKKYIERQAPKGDDHVPATRWLGVPDQGQLWQITLTGELVSYHLQNKWENKAKGKTLNSFLLRTELKNKKEGKK